MICPSVFSALFASGVGIGQNLWEHGTGKVDTGQGDICRFEFYGAQLDFLYVTERGLNIFLVIFKIFCL